MVICREEHLERVLAIKDRCEIKHIIVTSTEGYDIRNVSCSLPGDCHEFRTLIEENEELTSPEKIDPRADLCELAFTGGATGLPKGVMVTHFNQLRVRGLSLRETVLLGAQRRLRPVLMTATTAAFGLVPLLFATGPGSEIQRPLAIVVIGGVITATVLTLILLPILYERFGEAKLQS